MNKWLVSFLAISLLATAAVAQEVGDYRSVQNGPWRTLTTWEMWDGVTWATPTRVPGPGNNVLIQTGDTITFAASPDTCKNLVLEAGALYYCNSSSNRYLHVYGDSVRNDGTIGGPTDGVCFQCWNSINFTGTGTYQVQRLRAGVPDIQITFDRNFELHYSGAALYSNNNTGVTYTVNSDDTLTFSGSAYFSFSTSSTGPSAVGGSFYIYGAVILNTGSNFNISVADAQTSLLHVVGDLALGDTLIADAATTGNETVIVNGAITYASADTQKFDCLYTNNPSGVSFGFPVRVNDDLIVGWGDYDNSSGLTIADGAAITRYTGALTGAPDFEGGVYLVYGPNPAAATLTTGYEVPANDSLINNIIFNNAAGVDLNRDITCYGNVYLQDGIVTTGSYFLGCYNQPVRTAGYVDGTLGIWVPGGNPTLTYDVGTANGYSPASIAFLNVTVPGGVGVRAVQSTNPNVYTPANTMQRYWDIGMDSTMAAVFDSCRINFAYLPGDFNTGFTEADDESIMVVGKYDDPDWTFPDISARNYGGPADGGSIEIANVTDFSHFAMGKDQDAFVHVEPVYSIPFNEGFEGGAVPPADWSQEDVSGTAGNWLVADATQGHPPHAPYAGTYQAYFNSYTCATGNQTRLISPLIDLSGTDCRVNFWMYHETQYSGDSLYIEVSDDGGSSWAVLGGYVRNDGTTRWENIMLSLAAYDGDTVQLGFRGRSSYGNDVFIDEIVVEVTPPNSAPYVSVIETPDDTYDGAGPFLVRALIGDSAKVGIAADTLWYTDNATDWWAITHTAVSGDTFDFSIPGPIAPGTVIEYFLGAWDDQGAVTYDPGMYRGYQFKVLDPLPPTALNATAGDMMVQLDWAPPAQVLDYSDGAVAYYWYWNAGDIATTRFSPQHYPCKLEQAVSNWLDYGPGNDSVEIHVWPDDGTGLPDMMTDLIPPFKFLPALYPTANVLDLSSYNLILASGDFHIGYVCQTTDMPTLLSDAGGPGIRSMFYDVASTTWGNLTYAGNYYDYNHQAAVTYSAYTKGLALKSYHPRKSDKPLPQLAGLKANPVSNKQAVQYPELKGALAMAKNIQQFNVGRSLVSGGPYTTIWSTTGLNCLDTNVQNSTQYYYVVNAQYTMPYTVSANSNEATATPAALPILLVDDDRSNAGAGWPDRQAIYTAALDGAGYTGQYTVYEVDPTAGADGPAAAWFNGRTHVVWWSGGQWTDSNSLTANDEANLAAYLAAGGRLFYSAQDYLWDRYPSAGAFTPGQFPYDYLGLASADQDAITNPYNIAGVVGSLAEGLAYGVIEDPDVGTYADDLTKQSVAGTYDVLDVTAKVGEKTGVAYDNGTFRTVFFTTLFEDITDGANTKAELMYRILNWLSTGVEGEPAASAKPTVFSLANNYPNPVRTNTTIKFGLPKESQVRVEVYNIAGQRVKTLANGKLAAGYHQITWKGQSDNGQKVAAGVYLVRMVTPEFNATRKMTVIR